MEPWYAVALALVKPLMLVSFRRDFRGRSNVPPRGGAIFAANHVSVADPFTVALFIHEAGRRPRFMAKASVFRIPLAGRILRGIGQIPVDRNTPDAARALAAAAAAVSSGETVVIYPEGTTTRDPDYWPMRPRSGVARLAIDTGAPVIPLAVWGPQEFLGRRGRFRPLPRKTLRIEAGPALDLTAWTSGPTSPVSLQECADEIMRAVTELLAGLRAATPPAVPFDTRRSA